MIITDKAVSFYIKPSVPYCYLSRDPYSCTKSEPRGGGVGVAAHSPTPPKISWSRRGPKKSHMLNYGHVSCRFCMVCPRLCVQAMRGASRSQPAPGIDIDGGAGGGAGPDRTGPDAARRSPSAVRHQRGLSATVEEVRRSNGQAPACCHCRCRQAAAPRAHRKRARPLVGSGRGLGSESRPSHVQGERRVGCQNLGVGRSASRGQA